MSSHRKQHYLEDSELWLMDWFPTLRLKVLDIRVTPSGRASALSKVGIKVDAYLLERGTHLLTFISELNRHGHRSEGTTGGCETIDFLSQTNASLNLEESISHLNPTLMKKLDQHTVIIISRTDDDNRLAFSDLKVPGTNFLGKGARW